MRTRYFWLAFIFLVGFAALIYQIYSIRVLFMYFVETTHAAAIAVSSFLAGLACSSLFFSRLSRHNTRNVELLLLMMTAAGVYGYVVLINYHWVPLWLDGLEALHGREFLAPLRYLVAWLYLFPPAFFLGGAMPLVNGLYLRSLDDSTQDTGTVYFWDTAGAIIGALVAGFILLPLFGPRITVTAAVVVNLCLAAALTPKRLYVFGLLIAAACAAGAEIYRHVYIGEQQFRITKTGFAVPAPENLDTRFGTVLFQKDSPYGRVTVGQIGSTKNLFINYRNMCNFEPNSSEQDIAIQVMSELPANSRLANIGLGCGYTASKLALHPKTQSLDIIEINPVVVEGAALFETENSGVLKMPNVRLSVQDGAAWLRNTKERYDGIVIDIEEVSVIYSSPLYTKEYFTLVRERLSQNGVFGLWSFAVGPQFTKVMLNTLKSVFPYVVMRHSRQAMTYYASQQPMEIPTGGSTLTEKALALPLESINTLENPALEKYYDSRKSFNLPKDYREDFVR